MKVIDEIYDIVTSVYFINCAIGHESDLVSKTLTKVMFCLSQGHIELCYMLLISIREEIDGLLKESKISKMGHEAYLLVLKNLEESLT